MNILNQKPPIYDKAKAAFGDLAGMVFCYGDTIYFPDGKEPKLPADVIVHEAVHSAQQEELGPMGWWKKYLNDPEFRFRQELQAYQEQYQYCCAIVKDRNERARIAHRLAADLSGPAYGRIVDGVKALTLIKEKP